jgi:Cu+-exporting ATPase
MTMTDSNSMTKDPICGMTVDKATALHEERDGKSFSFCSEGCRQKFLSAPAGAMPDDKAGCGCGKKCGE